MTNRAIVVAALAAGLLVQAQGLTQVPISTGTSAGTIADAEKMSDPEKAAGKTWRAVMKNTPMPENGCFHASYPNVAWEHVDCQVTQPRAHHAPAALGTTGGAPETVGNDNDYIAQAPGLIYLAEGRFTMSGVSSETNAGVAAFGGGGILGANEYSLQINTNNNGSTGRCAGHPGCRVWQQFIYATDYNEKGKAALFIQYWLLEYNAPCPSYWTTSPNRFVPGEIDCFINSESVTLPNLPVVDLGGRLNLQASVGAGNDYVVLEFESQNGSTFRSDIWGFGVGDGVLDIASVWNQAEFNIVGDTEGSQAVFNKGSQITVFLGINDGTTVAPTCVGQSATTGETNNLNLGSCTTGVGAFTPYCPPDEDGCVNGVTVPHMPFIEFTESLITKALPPVGPGPCLGCVAE